MCYCRVFALSYFVSEGSFQVQASGGLYSEGQFDGGSFALRVLGGGAYIWDNAVHGGPYFWNLTVS